MWNLPVKPGDVVKFIMPPFLEWMEGQKNQQFEVIQVFEYRCVVRYLDVQNSERYLFTEKNNFEVVGES